MVQKKQKYNGCVSAIIYSFGAMAIVGGCFCLPGGLALIVLGIGWILLFHEAVKQQNLKLQQEASEEAERQQAMKMIEENTNEALCQKTLAAIENNQPIETLDDDYKNLTPLQREYTLNRAFEYLVDRGIEDGMITDEEEYAITKFSQHFGITEEHFYQQEWYKKYQKLLVIKDVLNGIIPQRQSVDTTGVFINLTKGEQLILGPYQGPLACLRIAYGRGVCGTAWKENRTIVVPDVEEFPGHIACSSESKSEIVVPLHSNDDITGVLDIDSEKLATFDNIDALWLERIVVLIH